MAGMAFLLSSRSTAGRALTQFEGDAIHSPALGRISACIPAEGTSTCRDEEASQTPAGCLVPGVKNEEFDTAGILLITE